MNPQAKVNLYKRLLREAKAELQEASALENHILGIARAIETLTRRATDTLQTGRGRDEAALVDLEGTLKRAHDQMMLAYTTVAGL